MKNKFLIILFFLGLIISDVGAKPDVRIITGNPYDFRPSNVDAVIKTQVALNANNIGSWVWNTGVFNQDLRVNNTPGLEWPKNSGKFAIFTSGLSIGTYINGNLRMGNASYNGEYAPGYVDQTVPTEPKYKNGPEFKLYRIVAGDNAGTNPDYANWGLMVPYGAPYIDNNSNGQYDPGTDRPGIKDASQTVFVCLTDADPSNHTTSEGFSGGTLPIYAETHLTLWAYTTPGLEDLQFFNWVVINKSGRNWDSTHFGVVVDPDLGDADDDYIGCDLTRNMGFCYNSDDNDGNGQGRSYGANPPASGMDFFKSPIIPTGNLNDADTSYFPPGSENRVIKRGYKQLGLSSFVYFTNTGSPGPACEQDPSSAPSLAYNYLRGIKKDGTPWVNPQNQQTTKYCYPGDPETGAGWTEYSGRIENCGGVTGGNQVASPPGDRRFIFNSGASTFRVAPGDTQNIVVAQFVARGSNNKNAVTRLKNQSDIAQKVFDLNFKVIPPPPPPVVQVSYKPNSTIGTVDVTLSWGDVSEQYNYQDQLFNQGTYKFQGYEIYEIKKSSTVLPDFTNPADASNYTDLKLIDVYDLRDSIGIVIDTFKTGVTVNGTEQFAPFPIAPPFKMTVPAGFPNKGLQRSITLNQTQFSGEYGGNSKFIAGNEYKFAIVAYGVVVPRTPTSVLKGGKVIRNSIITQMITIKPEAPTAGTSYSFSDGDTINTNRRDLGVIPKIVDQTKLLNAKYRVSFRADTTYNILRSLNGGTSYDTLKRIKDYDSKFLSGKNNTDTSVLNLKFTRNRAGGTDSARVVDGILFNVVAIRKDSAGLPTNQGVLKDYNTTTRSPEIIQTRLRGWDYFPSNNNWLEGSKFLYASDKAWQSNSMSLSFPTILTYTGLQSSYKADSLKRVKIVFQTDENSGQLAYRYVATAGSDPNYTADPSYAPYITNRGIGFIYQDRKRVPFKVYEVDPLTNQEVRQLNCAFLENNDSTPRGKVDGKWMPMSDSLGSGERLYIFGSTYQDADIAQYTALTTTAQNLLTRQPTIDIMYVWSPKAINASARWVAGDQFYIYPYTVTRPGVLYEFDTQAPKIGNTTVASETNALNDIRVVPNPYYGFNVNEKSSTTRFVTFRKLPINCTIRIYTLNGDLVKKIVKTDQSSTVNWELKNLDDVPVASGLYIALIDAPGIGQRTIKLAIFTPEERIDF